MTRHHSVEWQNASPENYESWMNCSCDKLNVEVSKKVMGITPLVRWPANKQIYLVVKNEPS